MTNNEETRTARLYSAKAPEKADSDRFVAFLRRKYGEGVELEWVEDRTMRNGFRLEVGTHVYDWSEKGLFKQFDAYLNKLRRTETASQPVIPLIAEALKDWTPAALAEETGEVISVADGIAMVSGLENAAYGEILLFESDIRGMVLELDRSRIGCILFGDGDLVVQGSTVRRTGKTAGMPVGEKFIGRVIDALGNPLDGKGGIPHAEYRPIESPAPEHHRPAERQRTAGDGHSDHRLDVPHRQGAARADHRRPQTGKTAIAVDAILNQKGKNVVCIYVAVGQKVSSVLQLVDDLAARGAMEYTVVVNSGASDSAALQYIAPYAGCTLGEYFMNKGRDVLIVYDDLSKHAVAYRTLSLLLERSPGREAYPGDVFYLHSRLLERAAHLSDARGAAV